MIFRGGSGGEGCRNVRREGERERDAETMWEVGCFGWLASFRITFRHIAGKKPAEIHRHACRVTSHVLCLAVFHSEGAEPFARTAVVGAPPPAAARLDSPWRLSEGVSGRGFDVRACVYCRRRQQVPPARCRSSRSPTSPVSKGAPPLPTQRHLEASIETKDDGVGGVTSSRLRKGRLHALHEEPQVLRHHPYQLQTGGV